MPSGFKLLGVVLYIKGCRRLDCSEGYFFPETWQRVIDSAGRYFDKNKIYFLFENSSYV